MTSPKFPSWPSSFPGSEPGDFQQSQGQSAEVSKITEFAKIGTANISTLNATTINGYPAPTAWLPYPAGTYVFPSGDQTVAEGVLAIGSDTTAPTFGTGSQLRAWYRTNRDSIDIKIMIHQTTNSAANSGTGTYMIPLPFGFDYDTNYVTIADATIFGQLGIRAVVSATGATLFGTAMTRCNTNSNKVFSLAMHWGSSAGTSTIGTWGSTVIGTLEHIRLDVQGSIIGIPVLQ